jgi:perosamine synthetase
VGATFLRAVSGTSYSEYERSRGDDEWQRAMTRPKNIIYPLRYLRPMLPAPAESEAVFEERFAALLGGKVSVIPLGRARAALYVLTKLALTETRRRVILSPYTIPDLINMVRFAGGEPVFVDCREGSTNIDVGQLGELLGPDTACVFITHYHVSQNETAAIVELCRRQGVKCFDDCAIALGAEIAGQKIGTLTDASLFSLSSFKSLNFFWAGAITTRDAALAEAAERLVEAWPRLTLPQYGKQVAKTLKFDVATRPALFSRLVFPLYRRQIMASEVQDVLPLHRIESTSLDATITSRPALAATAELNRKMHTVEDTLDHRRRIAAVYDRHFGHRVASGETAAEIRAGSAWVNYPIVVSQARRNDVYREILSQGYDVGLSLYPNVQETAGFTGIPGRTDNVSALVRSIVTLPTHPRISEDYAEELARSVAAALAKHGLN